MWVYDFLSRAKILNKYVYKLIFINIFCLAIPIAGTFIFLAMQNEAQPDKQYIFSLLLIFTIVAIIVSVWLFNNLTRPISLAQQELDKYIKTKDIPELPSHYTDEVGIMLRDLKKNALSINRLVIEKNDINAMLSHDLRSPMISIIGLIKLIKDQPDNEQATYFCDKIEEFGYHQLKLMESILSLMNEENQSQQAVKKVNVNLSKILAQSLSQFELTLQNKQLAISQNIPPQLNVKVEPYSFSQVISNLIHNAIKFSKKGNKIIVNASNGGDEVKISVQDQGIGFALENPNILFERFTPERKRGTMGEPTNGLGLYLARKIMEKHQGSISAESQGNNKGAVFQVKIPS